MPVTSATPALWDSAKADLRGLFPEDVFKLWFDPIVCVEATAELITLGVPNDFAAIWINDNYIDLIQQRLRLTSGREMAVKLRKITADSASGTPFTPAKPRVTPPRRVIRVEDRPIQNSSLNPRNTFETFVVGDNNQMAAAKNRGDWMRKVFLVPVPSWNRI